MNQTFNLTRFAMLFKKHTIENYKTYLMSAAVLAGLLILLLGVISYNTGGYLGQGVQFGVFMAFLLLAGCIFTSMIFSEMGDKKKAIPALTLPASHFEKYLVGWLYSFIIFQVVYVGIFYLITTVIVQMGQPGTPQHPNAVINLFTNDFKPHPYYTFIIYTFLHALTILGAIYFEKLHFIKTGFAFFIAAFAFGLINKPIMNSMINEKINGTTFFSPISFTDGKQYWTIHAVSMPDYSGAIVLGLVVLILWISAYYKLKEKEV